MRWSQGRRGRTRLIIQAMLVILLFQTGGGLWLNSNVTFANGENEISSSNDEGTSTSEVISKIAETDKGRAEQFKRLENVTESLYTNMQQGNTKEAKAKMDELINTLVGLSFKGLTSVEGIHALAESIMDAKEAIARVEIVPEQWIKTSASLRLAVNSLLHKEEALWLQYYKVMMDSLKEMEKARTSGSPKALREAFEAFKVDFETIRSAAVISRDPSEINRFESWLSHMDSLSSAQKLDESAVKSTIQQGNQLLNVLFGRRANEPVFLPITGRYNPLYWGMLIGGWILLALSYTGIRKYRAEQSVIPTGKPKEYTGRFKF